MVGFTIEFNLADGIDKLEARGVLIGFALIVEITVSNTGRVSQLEWFMASILPDFMMGWTLS